MSIIPKERLHSQPVAKGISLARKISFADARDTFGARLLSPDEIEKFAKKHPWRFKLIMRKIGLATSAVSFSSNAPLRSLIKDGRLEAESCNWREIHKFSISQSVLEQSGIDLDMPRPFLVMAGGYSFSESGSTRTVSINAEDNPMLFIYQHNGNTPLTAWYREISGVPVPMGKPSYNRQKGMLFCFERDDSKISGTPPLGEVRGGLVRRGAGLCDNGRASVSISGCFDGARGALYRDDGASAFAAFKNSVAQTFAWMKEIANGKWGRQ